ncbi:MAG TPA: ferritin family protein [Syntrophorhabdaceae bacterium]|jgi:rubrerythrin|nr:ferritin family protein [Syntrophorhabdaceae bacterium]MDI9561081.1 ferritin family protein [Pseudomonadota bacterium]OQC48387.1 MAG: Rubrerythrin [Deltaproteobacteria bacterium ADurb.Bin026]HPH41110.1 ferritin family protein [Syntrophorhabdaceae bacterium]HPN97006.1 ferritin family protein [Syntrophorhabdaceae bacterium]
MSIFLQASDVFRFAIRVEEDGELFYHKAAMMADDKETGKLFDRLADEEIRHKRIFQDMLAKIDEYRPPERYTGEYMAYLRDYIDNKVIFTKDVKDGELKNVHNTLSALEFAIQRELDSILYYQEAKQFVAPKHHEQIDKIIEEERKHFATLSEIKKNYQNK